MKNKSSIARTLLGNFKRLVPFVGFLLVITGILGLIFVQKPLEEPQEIRSDASEPQVFLPNIKPTDQNQKVYLNEETTISLDLNTAENTDVKKVNLVFNIINEDIDVPFILVNAGSGLSAELIEVEKATDGYLVNIKAVPNNIVWDTPPTDTSFIKITFKSSSEGKISFNFDSNNTYLEDADFSYSIDTQTINYDIVVRPIVCERDTFQCEDGTLVGRVAPSCNFASCPNAVNPEIKQCNQLCDSNANCQVGFRCFNTGSEKRCRLAISPSSTTCSQLSNQACDKNCIKSADCQQGLFCWDNKCRNPRNVDSSTCANLSITQQAEFDQSCGEECSTNANCGINLRCYNNVCRLATNPSSLTCSPATIKTVSKIYDEESSLETVLPKATITPNQKGDDIIPRDQDGNELQQPEINLENNNENLDPSNKNKIGFDEDNVPVDETALDLLLKMIKDKQQGMPTAIVLLGIFLLVASLIAFLIAKFINFRSRSNNSKLPELDRRSININSHDIEPGESPVVNPKSPLKPEVEPIVKQLANDSKPELSTNTPKIALKSTQNIKVKELLEKINQQSNKQN